MNRTAILVPLFTLCSLPFCRPLSAALILDPPQEQVSSQPKPQGSSQESKDPQEAATASHVSALLDRMLNKSSFALHAKYTYKNPLSALPIPLPFPKKGKKNNRIEVDILQTHTPEMDSWSLKGKKATLFRKGNLWAIPIEGTFALSNDRKRAENWNNKILPDGVLLARSLKSLLPKTKWKDLGSETFDDRPVLVWRCRLKGTPARLFQGTRMTQAGGPFGTGMVFFMNLPGMNKRKPIDVQVEITLYEDPGHKLPIRATIRTFLPRKMGNGPGGVIIQLGGQGQQNNDEEKEKKLLPGETKTHKLATNLELLFSRWGHIKPKALPPIVEKLLK